LGSRISMYLGRVCVLRVAWRCCMAHACHMVSGHHQGLPAVLRDGPRHHQLPHHVRCRHRWVHRLGELAQPSQAHPGLSVGRIGVQLHRRLLAALCAPLVLIRPAGARRRAGSPSVVRHRCQGALLTTARLCYCLAQICATRLPLLAGRVRDSRCEEDRGPGQNLLLLKYLLSLMLLVLLKSCP
jgi:hypothetical protein